MITDGALFFQTNYSVNDRVSMERHHHHHRYRGRMVCQDMLNKRLLGRRVKRAFILDRRLLDCGGWIVHKSPANRETYSLALITPLLPPFSNFSIFPFGDGLISLESRAT